MSEKVGLPPEIAAGIPALREHLREVLESPAFKGSRRSQQFLQHIVERALSRRWDELKERTLGVELFGRSPSYDTGVDAIVRVTASDVRKRLHQFYAETGAEIRIELHSGSYVPEFRRTAVRDLTVSAPVAEAPQMLPRARWFSGRGRRVALSGALCVGVAAGVWLWNRQSAAERTSPRHVLPWSILLQDGRQLQVVFADPDISAMQELIGWQISLSDYANRRYVANPEALGSDMQRALRVLRGANVPSVDAGIALTISRLAAATSARLKTHTARSLQLGDFKTDDDFVILGSPRSNPWGGLFQEQLDFDFIYDQELKREVIRNKRPQAGEPARYVPTARGWDTGDAFAIVALVGNPNQTGQVLLMAGTNAEGTGAAGELATNCVQLSRTLQAHGIDPSGPVRHFEILLRVRTMAGSPNTFEVIACRRLPNSPTP